ncbi:hypothetical protein Taro_030397 [Colocasia esculenta]|uniref:Uncharacterized protein n=1 Tax=Colocasia esculenta TaxID=4460 RepID=A0A843VP12_COLES|nr:hypothetical protein [Colocasia esculenta]
MQTGEDTRARARFNPDMVYRRRGAQHATEASIWLGDEPMVQAWCCLFFLRDGARPRRTGEKPAAKAAPRCQPSRPASLPLPPSSPAKPARPAAPALSPERTQPPPPPRVASLLHPAPPAIRRPAPPLSLLCPARRPSPATRRPSAASPAASPSLSSFPRQTPPLRQPTPHAPRLPSTRAGPFPLFRGATRPSPAVATSTLLFPRCAQRRPRLPIRAASALFSRPQGPQPSGVYTASPVSILVAQIRQTGRASQLVHENPEDIFVACYLPAWSGLRHPFGAPKLPRNEVFRGNAIHTEMKCFRAKRRDLDLVQTLDLDRVLGEVFATDPCSH